MSLHPPPPLRVHPRTRTHAHIHPQVRAHVHTAHTSHAWTCMRTGAHTHVLTCTRACTRTRVCLHDLRARPLPAGHVCPRPPHLLLCPRSQPPSRLRALGGPAGPPAAGFFRTLQEDGAVIRTPRGGCLSARRWHVCPEPGAPARGAWCPQAAASGSALGVFVRLAAEPRPSERPFACLSDMSLLIIVSVFT